MNIQETLDGYFALFGTYSERKVKRDEFNKMVVDTALVTDRSWLYETAVCVSGINNGDWVVVEGAQTYQEAEEMHERWVNRLKEGVNELFDIYEQKTYRRRKNEN